MKGMVPDDPHSEVSQNQFAVIYVPRFNPKRSRTRFPANCVEVMASEQAAIEAADSKDKYYAAVVHGPSKSSEGQFIYYLRQWLSVV